MHTKYVYYIVLFVVLAAWFGHASVRPHRNNSSEKKTTEPALVTPVTALRKIRGVMENVDYTTSDMCNIESADGRMMSADAYPVAHNKKIHLAGWALNTKSFELPSSVTVVLSNKNGKKYYAPASLGYARVDVRNYFSAPNIANDSGFEVNIDLGSVSPGDYSLALVLKFHDTVYLCNNGRTIIIP